MRNAFGVQVLNCFEKFEEVEPTDVGIELSLCEEILEKRSSLTEFQHDKVNQFYLFEWLAWGFCVLLIKTKIEDFDNAWMIDHLHELDLILNHLGFRFRIVFEFLDCNST